MIARINIDGFDEYGRRLSEIVEVDFSTMKPVYSKNKYAYLGLYFRDEWYTKIGEWFWK